MSTGTCFALAAILSTLAGCARVEHYTSDTRPVRAFAVDSAACASWQAPVTVRSSGNVPNVYEIHFARDAFRACMIANGWRVVR